VQNLAPLAADTTLVWDAGEWLPPPAPPGRRAAQMRGVVAASGTPPPGRIEVVLAPRDDTARVRALLRERFAGEIADVLPLAGGEFSRAFAFTAGSRDYVVRLSAHAHAAEAFAKDDYAGRHFASPALPIPRVVAIGQTADRHFAISERTPGSRLETFAAPIRRALFPALLDVLDAIGRANLRGSRGYGAWDREGIGEAACWRDFLTAIMENKTDGFYRDWHALFRDSLLEREVYEAIYRRLLRLVEYCPEERALVHADLHFDNLLADGRRITGVIDWGNACYGDPLYDVAWLGRWTAWGAPLVDAALLRGRYGAAQYYDERIACYECFLGLDDLRFYAKTGRRAQYEALRDRLLARVTDDPGVA
jgi:hygromycin-B 4-O-kinase